jgi:TPR repeat protein
VKKRFILFMLLPTISLIANSDSFYQHVYVLQNFKHSSYAKQNKNIQARRPILFNTSKKVYRNRMPSVQVSTIDSKKFFFAKRAANNGNAQAQFDLAIMYATGKGVQKNEKIAFNWFHKSARNNYAPAKHYMGISFLQGRGVRKQTELARYWFRLAVKQGYRNSIPYLSKIDASRV